MGGDLIFNLYLREGTTALNSGNGAATRISLPLLTAGTYTINYRAQPGLQSPTHFGLNLFFGGDDQTPGISAVVNANGSTFAASSALLTHRLDGLPVLSSGGTLQYIDGDYRVTLSALSHERRAATRWADLRARRAYWAGTTIAEVSRCRWRCRSRAHTSC